MRKISKQSLILFCTVSLLAGVGVAYAAPTITYLLGMSVEKDVTVVDSQVTIPMDATVVASISSADPLTITAIPTGTYAVQAEGKTVHFYVDGVDKGNAVINSGQAQLTLAAGTLAVGGHKIKVGP